MDIESPLRHPESGRGMRKSSIFTENDARKYPTPRAGVSGNRLAPMPLLESRFFPLSGRSPSCKALQPVQGFLYGACGEIEVLIRVAIRDVPMMIRLQEHPLTNELGVELGPQRLVA